MHRLNYPAIVALALAALLAAGCAAAPTPDPKAAEAATAVSLQATQTASVPPATATPDRYPGVPARGRYNHAYLLVEEFDATDNSTKVYLYPDAGEMQDRPGIGGLYSYRGDEPALQPEIMLVLSFASRAGKYRDCSQVTWLLNGKTSLKADAVADGYMDSGYIIEHVFAPLPLVDFLQLANANTVGIQLCGTEFTLDSAEKEALKDFASRMRPKEYFGPGITPA